MKKSRAESSLAIALPAAEVVERRICLVRGQKVMLSTDLAALYEVEPRELVQAVKRNITRFPPDCMFQLSREQFAVLKSQTVISSWGGIRRALPCAFTEQRAALRRPGSDSKPRQARHRGGAVPEPGPESLEMTWRSGSNPTR